MRSIWQVLSCIRYREVFILQGAPAIGFLVAMGEPTSFKVARSLIFILANCCLVAHMWSFNDWADLHADEADGRKALQTFARKCVSPNAILGLSLGLMGIGLAMFATLGVVTFWLAVCITLLGLLYSLPGVHAKRIVLASSLVHLFGGFLHFLLGYTLFATINVDAMQLAMVFALIFTAGHGVQEIQDYEADRRAGVRTNAMLFGKRVMFNGTLAVFIIIYGYLILLTNSGVIPTQLGPLCFALALLHVVLAFQVKRAGFSFAGIRRYRTQYRSLFAVLGVSICFTVMTSRDQTSQSAEQVRNRVHGIDKSEIFAERVAR